MPNVGCIVALALVRGIPAPDPPNSCRRAEYCDPGFTVNFSKGSTGGTFKVLSLGLGRFWASEFGVGDFGRSSRRLRFIASREDRANQKANPPGHEKQY